MPYREAPEPKPINPSKELECYVTACSLSPDGQSLATALSTSSGAIVLLWDVKSATLRRSWWQNYCSCLTFSPDGTKLVTGSLDKKVRIWDTAAENQEMAWEFELPGEPNALLPASDAGTLIVGCCDGTIAFCDMRSKAVNTVPRVHNVPVGYLALAEQGTTLVSIGKMGQHIIWDIASRSQRSSHGRNNGGFQQWATSQILPDGKAFLSAEVDRSLRLWDAANCQQRCMLLGSPSLGCTCLAVSSDQKLMATAHADGSVRLWSAGRRLPQKMGNEILWELDVQPIVPQKPATPAPATPSQATTPTSTKASDQSSKANPPPEAKAKPVPLSDTAEPIQMCWFSADRRRVVTAHWQEAHEHAVVAWDLMSGEKLQTFRNVPFASYGNGAAIGADGRCVVFAQSKWAHDACNAHVYDVDTGNRICSFGRGGVTTLSLTSRSMLTAAYSPPRCF